MKQFLKLPRNVWMLGFVSLLTDISTDMIYSLLPLFLVSTLGARLITVGLIEGVAEAAASITKIFSGALSDFLGQRKGLAVLGYGLSTLLKPLFVLATSPSWVLVARLGDRIGKGIRVAPRDALVADVTVPQVRGAAYGLRQSLDTVGALTGPLIAAGLMTVSSQNFRLVFGLALLPGVLAVALLVIGVHDSPNPEIKLAKANPLHWEHLQSLGKAYWMLIGVTLLFNLGNSSEAFLLLRVQQIGVPTALVPLTLVVTNLVYCLSAYPVGLLSDRVGRLRLLIGGFCLYALVYLGFAFLQLPWQSWALFALYGLHLGLTKGSLLALVADQVPSQLRGTAFGFVNLAAGVALLPASLLAGTLWDLLGAQATFMTGSCFAVAAAAVLFATSTTEVQKP
jgi:MFS family permease